LPGSFSILIKEKRLLPLPTNETTGAVLVPNDLTPPGFRKQNCGFLNSLRIRKK
jgi:hypothetical protein